MKVYIYELGLLKTGNVMDLSNDELKNYVNVGNFTLLTIETDLTQSSKVLQAYVRKATV